MFWCAIKYIILIKSSGLNIINISIFLFIRYCPLKRGEDREKLKERLANCMTYGDVEQKPPAPPTLIKLKPKLPSKKEQWNNCNFF